MSHSVLWFSLWCVYRYQSISHSGMWFSLWGVYRYQPISHSVLWFSIWDVHRYKPISYSVLWFSLWKVYRYRSISVLWYSPWEIGVSLYHTLCCGSHWDVVRIPNNGSFCQLIKLIIWENTNVVNVFTLFIEGVFDIVYRTQTNTVCTSY